MFALFRDANAGFARQKVGAVRLGPGRSAGGGITYDDDDVQGVGFDGRAAGGEYPPPCCWAVDIDSLGIARVNS